MMSELAGASGKSGGDHGNPGSAGLCPVGLHYPGAPEGGGGGQNPQMLLLSGQLATPIYISQLTTIHQSLAPPVLFLLRWHVGAPPHRRIHAALLFGAERRRRAPQLHASANSGAVLTPPGGHRSPRAGVGGGRGD